MRPKYSWTSKVLIILPFLWGAVDAKAQEPQQLPVPEQWQLTLDVIKSRAQGLMTENNGLQVECQQLTGQVQELQRSINDQKYKNDQLEKFIQDKHNQTDQLSNLNQFLPWRKQLEDENKQEGLLGNELKALQAGDSTQNLNEGAIDAQNKELEARLDILRSKQLRLIKKYANAEQETGNIAKSYDQLKRRKDQLETNIGVYESRMEDLRESSLMALSWTVKRKQIVHAMVLADAANSKIRDNIKVLHEDIDILRDQVAKLERRLDFVKGHEAK